MPKTIVNAANFSLTTPKMKPYSHARCSDAEVEVKGNYVMRVFMSIKA